MAGAHPSPMRTQRLETTVNFMTSERGLRPSVIFE
jgi:hypothetical protein